MINVIKQHSAWLSLAAIGAIFMSVGLVMQVNTAECALRIGNAYKTRQSPGVYYISEGCRKRPIRNPAVFFSHFSSWSDVQITSASTLQSIPDHELNFLPWGPRRVYGDGSLIKTVTDPRVYLKIGNRAFPISTEAAFLSLGFDWAWIEDVFPEVIDQYQRGGDITTNGALPDGLTFKYPNEAEVYTLETDGSTQRRRHIQTVRDLRARYRIDRIAVLPITRVFADGTAVEISPEPEPAPAPTPVPTPSPTPAPSGQVIPRPNSLNATGGVSSKTQTLQPGSLSIPGLGGYVNDPAFGTRIRRLTNTVGNGSWSTQIYSQLQVESPDGNYYLLIVGGDYEIVRASDLSIVNVNLGEINVPRWHPTLPHTIVSYDSNADETLRILYHDVTQANPVTYATLPARFDRIRGNQSFEEIDRNGRWMAGMAAAGNDDIIFAYNLETKTIGAELSLDTLFSSACAPDPEYGRLEPDWLAASPLGNYLVLQWARDGEERCSGMETYNIQTGAYVGHVYENHQHGDLGVDAQGEFFMTFHSPDAVYSDGPYIGLQRLPGSPGNAPAPTFLTANEWGQGGGHISCQGPQGVCSVSTYQSLATEDGGPWLPLDEEIILQYTNGNILRVAHTRSTSCGYWVQPRASMTRSGDVIFASDWGSNRCNSNEGLGRGEAFLIDVAR